MCVCVCVCVCVYVCMYVYIYIYIYVYKYIGHFIICHYKVVDGNVVISNVAPGQSCMASRYYTLDAPRRDTYIHPIFLGGQL